MHRSAEDTDFDRLKNEATQRVLDTLADMPDAISMLLAAKSARVSTVANSSTAVQSTCAYCLVQKSVSCNFQPRRTVCGSCRRERQGCIAIGHALSSSATKSKFSARLCIASFRDVFAGGAARAERAVQHTCAGFPNQRICAYLNLWHPFSFERGRMHVRKIRLRAPTGLCGNAAPRFDVSCVSVVVS